VNTPGPTRRHDAESAQSSLAEIVLRYLAAERDYHLDLLRLIRALSGNGLSTKINTQIDELRSRRNEVAALRDEVLTSYQRQAARDDAGSLSDIILFCGADSRPQLHSHAQQVRALVIQTRIATERIGRRLSLMHDCLEEVLTGSPPSKSTGYDRAGRLRSRPSSRSLLMQRG
jgi:hypothetical protein